MMDFAIRFLAELWSVLLDLSVWLFLGAFLAGALKILLPADFVRRQVGRSSLGSVLKAVLLGVPLPLCSCGVIPTSIGLHKSGASRGSSVGFLISTPQTGLDSILVTASFLGWPLALFKVVAAGVTGVAGGVFTNLAVKDPPPPEAPPTKTLERPPSSDSAAGKLKRGWIYAVEELIGGIYGYLVVGILIAALIAVLVPPNALGAIGALQGILGMAVVLAVSLPLYVCSTGSVPIAASLIHAGLPLGSAVVFLMAGPATNAATLGAVLKTFGRKTTFLYLGVIVTGSLLFGLAFQAGFGGEGLAGAGHEHARPVWRQVFNGLAAAGLILLILRWSLRDLAAHLRDRRRDGTGETQTRAFRVSGMTCAGCARRVRGALEALPNVALAEVDWERGTVRVRGRDLKRPDLGAAMQHAGYRITEDVS